MSDNARATSIPRIDAIRFMTALDERNELRTSRHLSQIKVRS